MRFHLALLLAATIASAEPPSDSCQADLAGCRENEARWKDETGSAWDKLDRCKTALGATSAPASAAIPASASGAASSSDAPLKPHVTLLPDGGACLDRDAVQAAARDSAAWKAQLAEAQAQKAAVLVAVGAGGLVLGVVVGVLAQPLIRPPP